ARKADHAAATSPEIRPYAVIRPIAPSPVEYSQSRPLRESSVSIIFSIVQSYTMFRGSLGPYASSPACTGGHKDLGTRWCLELSWSRLSRCGGWYDSCTKSGDRCKTGGWLSRVGWRRYRGVGGLVWVVG